MQDDGDRNLEAVLAPAQAAVADLATNFAKSAVVDLEHCAAFLKTAREQPAARAASVKEIYGIAHNLKGQGGAFGHALQGMEPPRLLCTGRSGPLPPLQASGISGSTSLASCSSDSCQPR